MGRQIIQTTTPLSLETIFRISHDLKKKGKKIGYTHGAFDLFHYGHLYLLRKAAEKCDFLIVGIDSDENIRKYKAYSRPIISEQRRLELISELNCVGAAFINYTGITDNDHISLEKEFMPEILFSGRVYADEEGLFREASAIKAKRMKFTRNFESTTRIIDKIVAKHTLKYPGIN